MAFAFLYSLIQIIENYHDVNYFSIKNCIKSSYNFVDDYISKHFDDFIFFAIYMLLN